MGESGSRKGCDFSHFTGASKQVVQAIDQTKRALQSRPARIVVAAAVDVLALSNPTVGTLVAAYKISKAVYEVSKAARTNYNETHDPSTAVAAAARQTLKIGVSEVASQTIGTAVETSWVGLKEATGISTNEFQDRILTSAVKSTLEEVVIGE
jgi:hypothetical protein